MVSLERLTATLEEIRAAGLYKTERVITTPQSVEIKVQSGQTEIVIGAKIKYQLATGDYERQRLGIRDKR